MNFYDAWKRWAEDNGHHAGAKSTFGRNLRAVVPELKMSQPRVSGGRERRYERIGLRACNAEDPVPPVPDEPGTGYSTAPTVVNAQVNSYGTGGTGTTPLWGQHSAGTGSGTASPSGNGQAPPGSSYAGCIKCGTALTRQASRERGLCAECWLTARNAR